MSQAGSFSDSISPNLTPTALRVAVVQIGVLGVLLIAVFWGPITDNLLAKWKADPNWSHGWLIPLFSLYFLHQNRERLTQAPKHPNLWGLLILAASLAAYLFFAVFVPRAYPRTLAIIPAIFGMTLLMAGWPMTRIAAFPILFLALAVPLPDGLYIELTFPLRRLATLIASSVLPIIPGLDIELGSGTVIDYYYHGAKGTLNVEEACSGMRSMMTIVTLGFVMAYLGNRPLWQRLVMVLSCIPIALVCNALRVVITGVLYISGQKDLARGTPHALLGMLMLVPALGLFALVGYVLNHLFVEEPELHPTAAGGTSKTGGGIR